MVKQAFPAGTAASAHLLSQGLSSYSASQPSFRWQKAIYLNSFKCHLTPKDSGWLSQYKRIKYIAIQKQTIKKITKQIKTHAYKMENLADKLTSRFS